MAGFYLNDMVLEKCEKYIIQLMNKSDFTISQIKTDEWINDCFKIKYLGERVRNKNSQDCYKNNNKKKKKSLRPGGT